jgi:tRNA threonylcarbamoyladenosine biosynthesis protein TsaB
VKLVLAFDTATDVATSALLDHEHVLGERISEPKSLLRAVDDLLRDAGAEPADLGALVVGNGPGSFTSTRIGLAVARGLALALELPVAGVATLDALASAREDALPVIDARRREVFVPGPRAVAPDDLELEPGTVCIGSGAVRYRPTLEEKGARVPADDDPVHVPHARLHAALAHAFGPAEDVQPIYVRAPDAKVRSAA